MKPLANLKKHPLVSPVCWASVCSALLLAACASMGSNTAEEQVAQRANARWKDLIAGEFDKAYAYNTSGYRALVTSAVYRGRIGSAVKWVNAEVTKVTCPETAKCDAKVRLEYSPLLAGKGGGAFNIHLDETWLLEDGQWWIYQSISGK